MSLISDKKREQLKQLFRQSGIGTPVTKISPREKNTCPIPASFAQQRIWLQEELHPGSLAYKIFTAYRLQGQLNPSKLIESLNAIVARHEALRTNLLMEDGELVETIIPEVYVPLPLIDLQHYAKDEQQDKVRQLSLEIAHQPFDLAKDLLIRAALFQLDAQEHVLFLVLHFAVFDGSSMDIFIRELISYYEAFTRSQDPSLPELSIQYADFAIWHQQWLKGKLFEEQSSYWKGRLSNLKPELHLPVDGTQTKTNANANRGAIQRLVLPDSLTKELRALSQKHGATLFMTLLATFYILLWRYTGQEDIALGVPVNARNWPETQPLIGRFANTLVLRIELSGNPIFKDLLKQVRTMVLEAYRYQELPYEKLVQLLQPERDKGVPRLFNVMFQLLDKPQQSWQMADVRMSPLPIDEGWVAELDLMLLIEPTEQGLTGLFLYNSDRLEFETIRRMRQHFLNLLESILANAEQTIGMLAMLSKTEQTQILSSYRQALIPHWNKLLLEESVDIVPARAKAANSTEVHYQESLLHSDNGDHNGSLAGQQSLQQLNGDICKEEVDVYILDQYQQLLPIGIKGQLYLSSAALAKNAAYQAYCAGIFTHPLASMPVTKLYRTNSQACYCADGTIRLWASNDSNDNLATLSAEIDQPVFEQKDYEHSQESSNHPLQAIIASVWKQVLGIEQAEPHDNFFKLGGHSLMAAQFISRLRSTLHIELPLRTIFESPTVLALTQQIERLMRDKESLVLPPILPAQTEQLPLSFNQERLWFLAQLDPENTSYNIPLALRLKGRLNRPALEQAINKIVDRHAVLRTTFTFSQDKPIQHITPSLRLEMPLIDLTRIVESEREQELTKRITEFSYHRFDLARGPLIKVSLLQMASEEHILLLNFHHIVTDGWSMGIFTREMAVLYQAGCQGEHAPLLELPIQYSDFAIWQRQWLQGEFLEKLLSYWLTCFHDGVPLLKLPTDHIVSPKQSYAGGRQTFTVSREISQSLKNLSVTEGATIFILLLATFKVLLYKYTGQQDILVGVPIAGRNWSEIEHLIGFFVNVLGLRTNLSHDPTIRELFGKVRETALGAYAHQDLPVEKLVERLQLKRDLSRSLVQVTFAFQSFSKWSLELNDLTIDWLTNNHLTAKVDIGLFMWEEDGIIAGNIEYNRNLFEPETIDRFTEHFQQLLQQITEDPDQRLSALPEYLLVRSQTSHQVSRNEIYQLSNLTKSQLLIWIGQKMEAETPLYNTPLFAEIPLEVEIEPFQQAFQTLLNSSDALRTVFYEQENIPMQRVLPDLTYQVEYIDCSAFDDDYVQALMKQRSQKQFSLDKLLFDCVLIKLSKQRSIWYFNQHHLIGDGWSVSIIFQQMSKLYQRALKKDLPETVEIPQFQRYIDYEQNHEHTTRYLAAQNYWHNKLAKQIDPITFYGRSSVKKSTRINRSSYELGIERTERLKTIAVEKGSSIFNIFVAVLTAYLYRISNKSTISIGIPFHNRRSKAFKETIGLFLEILPIHLIIEDGETFHSLLNKVKAEVFETLRHSQYSVKNPTNNRAYDIFLNYHSESMFGFNFNEKDVAIGWIPSGYENYNLALQIQDFGLSGNFLLGFDFNVDLFEEQEQHQVREHLLQVLNSFLSDQEQIIQQISLLSAQEQELVLCGFNQTAKEYPPVLTLSQLFEAQVQRSPDQLALSFAETSLTYRELNQRANQLAYYLHLKGIVPDMLVGICMERSIEMVIALFGILKAGGTYVPLDPSYPPDRLSFMLAEVDAPILLTQHHLLAILKHQPVTIICLDTQWPEIAHHPNTDLDLKISPDNLAYVIYTSGSTGRPKGVMNTHRAIYNRLMWMQEAYQLSSSDRVLQKTPYSFDVSVWEFFWPLITGARLIVAQPEGHKDSNYLIKTITKEQITTIHFVPSMLQAFLEAESVQTCDSLRRVICSGEALPMELQNRFFSRLKAELHNLYGPTEAAVDVTYWACDKDSSLSSVPIGVPIANIQIYLLDINLQPVPIGVPGELHIGGIGLARGYWRRPELTAEKFIPDPFSATPGTRLYKTGDLARHLPDGNIEFLGRIDHQVKIRGLRIELGEIESILLSHPAIGHAVVMAQEISNGEKQLVAYLVSNLVIDWEDVDQLPDILDRRTRSLRVPINIPCQVMFDGNSCQMTVKMLSNQGLGLDNVPPDWQIGKHLRLHLHLPGLPEASWLEGNIRWNHAGRAGIKLESSFSIHSLLQKSIDHVIETYNLSFRHLTSFLKAKLPDYMVPSFFILHDNFPLTSSGKVDRKSLTRLIGYELAIQEPYIAPETDLDHTLVMIWQEMLKLEKVGLNNNFFDLGGHSLLLLQVQNKIKEQLSIEVPLVEFFNHPTISSLSKYLSQEQNKQSSIIKIQERANKQKEMLNQRKQLARARRGN